MPSPRHKCAHPDCAVMVVRKESVHCRKHAIKTPEHVAKITAKVRGQKRTPDQIQRMRDVKRGYMPTTIYGSERKPPQIAKRACAFCKSLFILAKPSSKARFCSVACGYKNRMGENAPNWIAGMPVKTCFICGKQFRISAQKTAAYRLTCSRRCKGIWQKKYHQPNKTTDIERITEQALLKRKWKFVPQVPLCGVAIVDFYLPEIHSIIFCDGDYWHGLPKHIVRDAKQTQTLEQNGYTVYRFKGSDILRDINECLAIIEYPFDACI